MNSWCVESPPIPSESDRHVQFELLVDVRHRVAEEFGLVALGASRPLERDVDHDRRRDAGSAGRATSIGQIDLGNMTITMNIAEAKAKLSQLLDAAVAGEHVVIARAGKPIATLAPIDPPRERELGFMPITIDDAFFAPLSDDEVADWA